MSNTWFAISRTMGVAAATMALRTLASHASISLPPFPESAGQTDPDGQEPHDKPQHRQRQGFPLDLVHLAIAWTMPAAPPADAIDAPIVTHSTRFQRVSFLR